MLTHELWINSNMSSEDIFNQLWRLNIKQIVIYRLRMQGLSYGLIKKQMPGYGYKKGISVCNIQRHFMKAVTQIHLGHVIEHGEW